MQNLDSPLHKPFGSPMYEPDAPSREGLNAAFLREDYSRLQRENAALKSEVSQLRLALASLPPHELQRLAESYPCLFAAVSSARPHLDSNESASGARAEHSATAST
eukprot:GDKI01018554.1.p1 GENE.GDKI01018554.1~~GDKI01018554.1.p1  ORF type:complete len:106 (-),score=10.00 GDKI01018554.1:1-318(-)